MKSTFSPLLSGTIILTITGFLSRLVGFYYKIFLSRTIGAKELGIYQLSLPLLTIGMALCCSGIHTALCHIVASTYQSNDSSYSRRYVFHGILFSLLFAAIFFILGFTYTSEIATYIFHETDCIPLLRVLLLCIPLECIHSCINAYYYGRQITSVPAISQCIEQFTRVGSVALLYGILKCCHSSFTSFHALIGLVIGEGCAVLFTITRFSSEKCTSLINLSFRKSIQEIFPLAFPVTLNRLSISCLSTFENTFLPLYLCHFGYTKSQALSTYGIFSGMALPMVYFPTVLSNSIAVMLLPSISKAKATHSKKYIQHAIKLSFLFSMLLGFLCSFFFFFFGPTIGILLFHQKLAGTFIKTLSWICPFLFLNTTTTSILNGLGKTKETFLIQMNGSLIRLLTILLFVAKYGFISYLLGLLISYIVTSLLTYLRLQSITI